MHHKARTSQIRAGAIALALTTIASTAYTPIAQADSSSQGTPAAHLDVEEAAAFSKQVERTLAERQARIAIVFRSGRTRDKLPEGINYTHGAFWVYQPIQKADGDMMMGYAVYNLYHGDGDALPKTQSYLAQDFPLDFTRGSVVDDISVIIPTPAMQKRILQIMATSTYENLHIPDYSLIANPLTAAYQNCNEFMLDVVSAAAWETADYAQLKANLRAHFTPTEIEAGPLKRMFAPVVDKRLRMEDQPGGISTVTYSSLAGFMDENALMQEKLTIIRAQEGS